MQTRWFHYDGFDTTHFSMFAKLGLVVLCNFIDSPLYHESPIALFFQKSSKSAQRKDLGHFELSLCRGLILAMVL